MPLKALLLLAHTNIWISLGAIALLTATDMLANGGLSSIHLYSVVFFATLLTYNWQRMLSVQKRQQYAATSLSQWVGRNLVSGMVASLVALAFCAYSFFHLAHNQQAALLLLGGISVLYALPLLPSPRGMIRLRDVGLTKPIVLGFTWGMVTAWVPLIVPTDSYTTFALQAPTDGLFVLARCLTMVAICIPFDIKDIQFDSATMAYPTLPVWVGIPNTLVLALALSFSGFVFLSVWVLFASAHWPILAAAFLSLLIECWFINKTKANSPEWHYIVVLDGLLLVHAVLVIGALLADGPGK